MRSGIPLPRDSKLAREMAGGFSIAKRNRANLGQAVARNKGQERELTGEFGARVELAAKSEIEVGELFEELIDGGFGLKNDSYKTYWAGKLCDSSSSLADLPGLIRIYQSEPTGPVQTSARKAIRLVDFASNGPPIDGE